MELRLNTVNTVLQGRCSHLEGTSSPTAQLNCLPRANSLIQLTQPKRRTFGKADRHQGSVADKQSCNNVVSGQR